jgi:glycosyltransferase involved in cell wall biosynthesis
MACKDKLRVIANGVDTEVFRPNREIRHLYNAFSIAVPSLCIGILSRLDWWKGHRLFFDSIALLEKNAFPFPIHVLVVGDGPDRDAIESAAKRTIINTNVIFAGHRNDVADIMNLCDIVVNPSTEPEPFGRIIIEAMACGKAVIATNSGGPKEIITDRVDGFLVEPQPEALYRCLNEIVLNESLRVIVGTNARKKALEKYTMAAHARQVELLYSEILQMRLKKKSKNAEH